jgi:hypothetical protein
MEFVFPVLAADLTNLELPELTRHLHEYSSEEYAERSITEREAQADSWNQINAELKS